MTDKQARAGEGGRRSPLRNLVSARRERPCHESARNRSPFRAGVKMRLDGPQRHGEGPEGRAGGDGPSGRSPSTSKGDIVVTPKRSTIGRKTDRALHGLWRALLAEHGAGVTEGYTRKLELVGVGYRAEMKGKTLQLAARLLAPDPVPAPRKGSRSRHPRRRASSISGIDKAARRPGRREDPLVPSARALQGQGHEVRGRTHPPEGRQGRCGERREVIMRSGRNDT